MSRNISFNMISLKFKWTATPKKLVSNMSPYRNIFVNDYGLIYDDDYKYQDVIGYWYIKHVFFQTQTRYVSRWIF